ncbi:MAG: PAS domain S-box protein [Acidobacteriota bacterium]|nr:PAS domain S-box protein [Acidobacteriota bacterium]
MTTFMVATATIAAAVLLRWLLTPWMGSAFPLATMFVAVAFAVWYGGWFPALYTAIGGYIICDWLFIPGIGLFGRGDLRAELIGLSVYLGSCISIMALGQAMRVAQQSLEAGHRELSSTNLALTSRIEAHSLLASIVASSDDAIISKTLDGTITSWNAGAERLFGYTPTEAIGKSIMLIVPPDRRDEELSILERIRHGERVEHLDVVRVAKDGRRVDVSVTVSPLLDRDGRIAGASKIGRDITSRKEVEAALLQREISQRLLVSVHDSTRGLTDPVMVIREIVTRLGVQFGVTRCAYAEVDDAQELLVIAQGYTNGVATVAGRYRLEIFGPQLVRDLKAGHTAVINDVGTDIRTSDPVARATYAQMQIRSLVCVPLVRNHHLVAVLVMADGVPRTWSAEDATLIEQVAERTLFAVEGARAAAVLRENRDVLSLAMGAGQMGAWSRDLVADTVWWSRELEQIVGLPPGGLGQTEGGFRGMIHDDDRPRVAKVVQEALEQHEDYTVEFRIRHASGEWLWMEGCGKATYGADGKPQMLYGLGIDVTERHRAVEALKEADRRKDEFLATLAHELRNPLAPISSGLHIMRMSKDDPAAVANARAIMERQVRQMVRLVDDLLDVARISTGKVELQRSPMELASAIQDAAETSGPVIAQSGHRLEIANARPAVWVDADRTRLAQVFANLLNNSAKYSEPGRTIRIGTRHDGDLAVVTLKDEGIGIRPEMLPRVFEMFRQADRSGPYSHGGLGIGLFIVKRLVEMHGGTIDVRSNGPGTGTEFEVRLPAIAAPAATVAAESDADDPASQPRRRVLVVDDNQDAAEALAMILSMSGHDTELAHDGIEALNAAASFRPEVIFLDIGMPTLDGHETARRIREQPWGKDMVLVALTGWGQAEDRRKSREAGFNHHLVKPADPTLVAELLSKLPLVS